MKKIILIVLFFNTIISIKSQNTTFDNVSIGISAPIYGTQIKANFPGYTGGWSRAYSIANESGNQSYFTFGTTGFVTNGISSVLSSYIGKDLENRYMTFMPNGNIGVGTSSPRANLDMAHYIDNGQIGTVFGRLAEGDNTGLGTFLGVQGFYTQGEDYKNVKSFSIVHNFYGETNNSINFYRGGGVIGGYMTFCTDNNNEQMRIAINGNVGIGTIAPDEKLTVKGNIHTREVRVDMAGPLVPDYVFADDYKLKSLQEIEDYVKEHKHLPEIPSAKEIENNGLKLGEMNMALLKKMEEMTLYMIEQNKQIKNLEKKIETLTNKQ